MPTMQAAVTKSWSAFFSALFVSLLLSGCSGGGSSGEETPADTTAPTVSSTSPASGATGVAVSATISATFSETMNAATITTSTFTLATTSGATPVTGTVALSGNVATFTPGAPLTGQTSYTATISTGAQDAAGNALAAASTWSFTTVDNIAPTVIANTPVNTGVVLNTSISATFSETMLASTINTTTFTLAITGGATVSGTVTLSGNTATFDPAADLAASTSYTATITTGAQDAAGNALAANKVWTFTTGTVSDTTLPTVTSTSPLDTATGVALNRGITATFSETMLASTINTTTFTLAITGGATVSGTVTLSGDTATFDPTADLAASTGYTATITTGAQDAAGNALAANKVWTFTTGAAADTAAPTVGSVSPPDLSIGRSINAPVNAIFSEAMNAVTITTSTFTLVTTTGSTPVVGAVTYDAGSFKAEFKPTAGLAGNTSYTATITTGVTDAAGNALATAKTWSFTTQTPTLRHFTGKSPSNTTTTLGTLYEVDPYTQATTSTSNVLVERLDGVDQESLIGTISTATFNNPDNNLENQRRYAIAYVTDSGTLTVKTVEQLTQGAATTTTTFSNATGITSGLGDGSGSAAATDLCDLFGLTDYASVANSMVIYVQAGTDNTCGAGDDDTFKFVRVGAGASATVSTISGLYSPQAVIYDMADTTGTGAVLGLLAVDYATGNLHRLSGTDLSTVTAVTGTSVPTGATEAQVLGYFGSSGNMVLRVGNTIRTYNVSGVGGTANSISPSRATLAAANWLDYFTFASSSSGPSLFFADTTAGTVTTIQSLDFSTSPPTLNASFYTGGTSVLDMDNTADRVIFNDGGNVKSILKTETGGAATTIASGSLQGVSLQSSLTPRVYVNGAGAISVNDDGTSSATISNSRWLSGNSSTTYSFANTRHSLRNIVLLTRAVSAVDDQGATLTNYDAPTSIAGETLGTLPTGVTSFDDYSGTEKGGPLFLMRGINLNTTTDIYYVDPFVANSLNNLGSDTNGLNDLPVQFWDFVDY